MKTEDQQPEEQPEDLKDIGQPVWFHQPNKGYTLECGMFTLDHDKSEFEMAEIGFKNQVGARIIVCTKPVTDRQYDHGWDHPWYIKFFGSHWKEQEFRGRAKTVEAAKAMAYNVVLGLWIGMGLKPTKPFQEAEVEALRAEVRALRHDKSMIRYVLKNDHGEIYQKVKHYMKGS